MTEFGVVLEQLQAGLLAGRSFFLATIIESKGSTPRSSGAYMLVGAEGRVAGTIGGGNMEYQAILAGQRELAAGRVESFAEGYELDNIKSAELGMVCGGNCRVLFHYFGEGSLAQVQLVLQSLSAGKPFWMLLPLPGAGGELLIQETVQGLRGRKGFVTLAGREYYAEKFAYDGRVYIFGGGHLAQELVPVLSHLGFRCVVIDDRAEFADKALFPQAEQVLQLPFTELEKHLQINEGDYLAVMTRGHLCDTDAERFALRTPAGYIGVVGSRRKTTYVRSVLKQDGFTDAELDRVVTPIGLEIGSETPAEIAISIAAQLIRVRSERYL